MAEIIFCCVALFFALLGIAFGIYLIADDEVCPGLGIMLASLIAAIVIIILMANNVPGTRSALNDYDYELEKADENTYENRKKVEDTCRAYIASYEADKVTYYTTIDSGNHIDIATANAAKIRANRTAAVYNEYYLKNSFVWEGNVPDDIKTELEYIK